MRAALLVGFALCLLSPGAAAAPRDSWAGVWSFDLCHEDRKGDHEAGSYCRQGLDKLLVTFEAPGRIDILRCPNDPWGERRVSLDPSGWTLRFTSAEGLEVRLTLGEDGAHFKGSFRSSDGHSGRAWGRRTSGCS